MDLITAITKCAELAQTDPERELLSVGFEIAPGHTKVAATDGYRAYMLTVPGAEKCARGGYSVRTHELPAKGFTPDRWTARIVQRPAGGPLLRLRAVTPSGKRTPACFARDRDVVLRPGACSTFGLWPSTLDHERYVLTAPTVERVALALGMLDPDVLVRLLPENSNVAPNDVSAAHFVTLAAGPLEMVLGCLVSNSRFARAECVTVRAGLLRDALALHPYVYLDIPVSSADPLVLVDGLTNAPFAVVMPVQV